MGKIKDVAAGEFHSLLVLENGTVASVGLNTNGQLGLPDVGDTTADAILNFQIIPGLSNISKVVAGRHVSFAIEENGNVWAWGENSYGQLGLGNTVNQFIPKLSQYLKITN